MNAQNRAETFVKKLAQPAGNTKVFETGERAKEMLLCVANETYAEVASQYGEYFSGGPGEIYWQNSCQQFSEIMKRKLKENGILSEFEYRDVKKINLNAKQHIHLSTPDYFIDGTWQQFLDSPRNNNHCLVLDRKNLISDLRRAKVPKKLWFIYGAN